jgi:hypothetical protein
MTKLKRFVGSALLIISLAVVTWADGGETHGPALTPPPPPECTTDCTSTEITLPSAELAADDVVMVLVTCLVGSIL